MRALRCTPLVLSLWCVSLFAQVPERASDPSLRSSSLGGFDGLGIAVEAGEENKQARVRWTKNTGTLSFSATLATPLDEKTHNSSFATLDGLGDATSLAGSLTKFFTHPVDTDAQARICEQLGISESCDDNTVLAKGGKEKHREFLEATVGSLVWFGGFEGKVGREKKEFFDVTDLSKSDDIEKPYSLSMSIGALQLSGAWIFTGKYQKLAKDRDKVTHCIPYEPDDRVQTCSTLPLGNPEMVSSVVLALEYRHFFEDFAVSPSVARDTELDVTSVDLPIYLLRDSANQFTGGIRLGYRDDKDDFTASVFVSRGLTIR